MNRNLTTELSNRFITQLTNTWTILDGLKLRGRVGVDVTGQRDENRDYTERPIAFGNSGYFGMTNYNHSLIYTDVMLNYTKKVTTDLELGAMIGYVASKETATSITRGTDGGLSTENKFDISASVNSPVSSSSNRYAVVKDAFIGTISANFKDFLYAEFTGRRDRTSTMHPSNNAFFYPSANASFIFSEVLQLPAIISAGKLRASWGIVGNYPDAFLANVAYSQGSLGVYSGTGILYTALSTSPYGNDLIRPEQKHEFEIGTEIKFLQNRLGLDLSYYNAQIVDQILPLTLPTTAGAGSILANVGTLRNQGIEVGITGIPVRMGDFQWQSTLNYAWNKNVLEKLASGATELQHADYDGNAAVLKSVVGQPMGDFYAHPIVRTPNGEPLVDPNGLYKVDPNTMVKVGNAMPKGVGGFINTFSYKNFELLAVIDYRIGGHVMPTGINWMHSRGLTEKSLEGMDAEHGGLTYWQAPDGTRGPGTNGPAGSVVYDNGIILSGEKALFDEGGSVIGYAANDNITTNPHYFNSVYNWGGPQYSPYTRYELYIQDGTYVKMRELSLSYSLPSSLASKIKAKSISVSVFGRNLFFLYRTLKDLDPEQLTGGSRWTQTVNNAGMNPATRTYGASLRISF